MFKITLGALIGSVVTQLLPSKRGRLIWISVAFAVFAAIEINFIAHGGD
ncbi:MAG: hypothetical protein Q8922_07305 [Bacteroidota bacterium]|nr:hypothetical protein [Bacteroidota bacterium]MDP4233542.1 hypothetical protein [Bacteroidota bacterium]MDP4244033.1 hypothetical protein [Bacteroidota bacterium]MDP4287728.1 hypothetical protein [Bacteroidota bacterium]